MAFANINMKMPSFNMAEERSARSVFGKRFYAVYFELFMFLFHAF